MSTGAIRIDWFPREALDGMQVLDPWEELAYRRILDLLYVSGGSLPDDNKRLGWMTKTGRKWPKIRDALIEMGKIEVVDGAITNPKCTEMLEAIGQKIENASRAGKASAEKRKVLKKRKTGSTPVGSPVATERPTERQPSQVVSKSGNPPSPPVGGDSPHAVDRGDEGAARRPSSGAGRRGGKATPLPDGWRPPPEDVQWAREQGHPDPDAATERFVNHHHAKGDKAVAWGPRWRNWVLEDVEKGYTPKRGKAAAPSSDDDALWRARVNGFIRNKAWPPMAPGEPPGMPGCQVPRHVLEEFNLGGGNDDKG